MGNVLDHDISGGAGSVHDADVVEDDLKWLAIKGSMVFNDDFLEEEYANLPQYDGTELEPDPSGTAVPGSISAEENGIFPQDVEGSSSGDISNDPIRRMLQLLGPQGNSNGTDATGVESGQADRGTSVEDFPPLLGETFLGTSTHATAARMRARLFQRMHLALLRHAFRSKSSSQRTGGKDAGASPASSAFVLPPSLSEKGRLENDSAAILTSASMRMSLTLMGALRASCPGLFVSMAQTLMDLFATSAPFTLGQVGSSSAYVETLSQVRKVAEDAAAAGANSPKHERSQAMALLLSLGLATGSVSDVVCVARHLLDGNAPTLAPSAEPFLKRLRDHSMPAKKTIPRPGTWTASFVARLESGNEQTSGDDSRSTSRVEKSAAAAAACNPATDGVYVYVWDPSSKGVHKVGTGFHGTLAGNVYRCRKNILDDIRAYKGMEPAPPEEEATPEQDEDDDAPREERITESGLAVQPFQGVIVPPAFAERRRSLMGTGENIGGGGTGEEEDGTDSSSSSSGSSSNNNSTDSSTSYFEHYWRDAGFGSAGSAEGSESEAFEDIVSANIGEGSRSSGMRLLNRLPPVHPPGGALMAAAHMERMAAIMAVGGENSHTGSSASGMRSNQASGDGSDNSAELAAPMNMTTEAVTAAADETDASSFVGGAGMGGRSPSAGVRLHRVPTPTHSATPLVAVAAAAGLAAAEQGEGRAASAGTERDLVPVTPTRSRGAQSGGARSGSARSRGNSPPRTMDEMFDVMGERLALRRDSRISESERAGGAGGRGGAEAGSGAMSRAGLLRFQAVEGCLMLSQVPESGRPEDYDDDTEPEQRSYMRLEEGSEGEIWSCKTVHGFRWYQIKILRTPNGDEHGSENSIGWVPLFTYEGLDDDDSSNGSMHSEERAELEGMEDILMLLDPATEGIIDPDSPRARLPPTWNGPSNMGGPAGGGRSIADLGATSRSSAVAAAGRRPAVIRPVWLALVGGKLFLREKASGALSAHEVAVLRSSDLSLETVVSLADLPITGFPKSWVEASSTQATKDKQKAHNETGTGDVGDADAGPLTLDAVAAAGNGSEEPEALTDFADASIGALVTGCSSNSDTSGGVLQNNLLVLDPLQRLLLPSGESSGQASGSNLAFSFAAGDTDRVIVVDLGRPRRLREVGVQLSPVLGIDFADAVGSLLVETSVRGSSWTTMGRWNESNQLEGNEAEADEETKFSAKVSTMDGYDQPARFIRYSLALPTGAPPRGGPPACFLNRLTARGVDTGNPIPSAFGDEEEQDALPFPAMTTDSRHIVLVHATGGDKSGGGGERKGDGDDDDDDDNDEDDDDADADKVKRLELFFIDPEDGYRLVKRVNIEWDMPETYLHKHGLLCDGNRLVMIGPQEQDALERTPDTVVVSLRCRCGPVDVPKCEAVDGHEAEEEMRNSVEDQEDMYFDVRHQGGLAPHGLGYDSRNNVMWGWDPVLKKLCRWRNDGLPPIFPPPRPAPALQELVNRTKAPSSTHKLSSSTSQVVDDGAVDLSTRQRDPVATPKAVDLSMAEGRRAWIRAMLTSPSPTHRVEGLEEAGRGPGTGEGGDASSSLLSTSPGREAALLLGYLERLGEAYGPPKEPPAEARARCELEAASGGHDDGNFSRLMVRGEDWSCKEAGLNVLVLSDNLDAEGEMARVFDLQESRQAADRLADYLNDVPRGRTVMVALQGNAAGDLTSRAEKALLSIGASHDNVTALGAHKRSSYALIGRKGAASGSMPQVFRRAQKGCATVRQRLPAPKVPMCVDVSPGSLHTLMTLILQHESVLLQPESFSTAPDHVAGAAGDGGDGGGDSGDALEIERSVVLSAVNVLTNQIFQLLRGATPAKALEAFSTDHLARLLAVLLAVIDKDQPVVSKQPQERRSTEPSATAGESSPHKLPVAAVAASRSAGSKPPCPSPSTRASFSGSRVCVVSCTGKRLYRPAAGLDSIQSMGQADTKALLQEACLRLFVTGMDLFYPSSEERCSLLARYLTKYLSHGLSPSRQTVLELLLRRMSDPGQLVEVISQRASSQISLPGTPSFSENPFVIPSTDGSGGRGAGAAASERDIAKVGDETSVPPALGMERHEDTWDAAAGRGLDSASNPGRLAGSRSPAPSPMELQSLLLRVATAESISKMNAVGRQVDEGAQSGGGANGVKGRYGVDGTPLPSGVGEAAVEMLGRLSSQLLSSAACIIIESDVGAFDGEFESEDLDDALGKEGIPPFPAPPTTIDETSKASSNATAEVHVVGSDADASGTTKGTDIARVVGSGGEGPLRCDMSAATMLIVLVTVMCRSCAALAAHAVEVADSFADQDLANDVGVDGSIRAKKGVLPSEADQLLQESPLGALLPMLASCVTLLVEKHGRKMQERLSGMAKEFVGVMQWVSETLARVPEERFRSAASGSRSVGTVKRTVVMESKHRYEPDTNELHELHIAGASRMTITFDPRSSTEEGYDYVVFWKDERRTVSFHLDVRKFSGSGYGRNFPGLDGRPPLVIESDRAFVEWKTDQSNEDWGWKFTAEADVGKPSSGGDGSSYWLLGLDRQLAGAGAALAGCLVISKPWGGQAEDDNAPWMEDDLLAGAREVSHAAAVAPSPKTAPGSEEPKVMAATPVPLLAAAGSGRESGGSSAAAQMGVGGEINGEAGSPELQCLVEVVDRLQGTGGSALCKAMRAKVGEDQGSIEAVNRAVYATCAALIWHQGLGNDALALAEGRAKAPSKALTKTWRFGQRMRQYFDYGDVRAAVDSQMELQRQQAVASDGTLWRNSISSAHSVDETPLATRPILTRGPSVYQGAEEIVIAEVSERIVSRALFLLALPSQSCRASSQEQTKRRWGLLSKLGTMGRTSSQGYSADGAELLERWKQVVDEATAMHKLKSILTYRRKAAEMRERAKKDSVGERIMRFVQCSADVAELELVRKCRDQRAQLRAEGLRVTRALVAAAASPPSKTWLLASHAQSIRLTKRDERPGAHVHYLSCVEGCEPNAHLALARQFALLVTSSLDILKECSRPQAGETRAQAAERRGLAVSALQALALDYDIGDHDILKGSILLEVLEPLLEGFDEQNTNNPVSGAEGADGNAAGTVDEGKDTSGAKQGSGGDGSDDGSVGGDEKDGSQNSDKELKKWEKAFMEKALGSKEKDVDGEEGESAKSRRGGGEEAVRRAAWCLFEVLLPRCVGLEGQGMETRLEEPTGFSHRLLDVLVRQVGRASANVQKSNASLGIGNSLSDFIEQAPQGISGLMTGDGVADSDKHIYNAVENRSSMVKREKCSHVRSALSTPPLPNETPLLTNGMRLRRDQPGRAAADREMGARHSLALWIRRDSCRMDAKSGELYAPAKAGDIVARGPKWPLGNMADGGPGCLGTVMSIMKSEMIATVKWEVTGEQGKYKMGAIGQYPTNNDDNSTPASVDDLLIWEVIKVDPSVGGNIVMKGGFNNLTEEERNVPWSRFGLSLQGNATLTYYSASGEDQLFALHSKHTLQPETWTHVAVVQAKSRCRIYIDGEEDAEVRVPSHMLNPGVGMPKRVIESQHPYANNTERTWEVAIEGAVSYSISFNPMTATEASHDFVRFCRGPDVEDEYFGEPRYSGGRDGSAANWPGVAGRPPLVIDAPSFWVYFRTDQSNFDWGFKLTCLACVTTPDGSDDENDEVPSANLNPFPVYLGQPPSYVSPQCSATGYIWGASTFSGALTPEQVRNVSLASSPPLEPIMMEEGACTDVLSLVQRCASSTDGAVSQGGSLSLEAGAGPLVSPQVLGPLLVLLLQGSLKLRLSAARLCEKLLPQAPPEMVQVQLSKVGLAPYPLPASLTGIGPRGAATPLVRGLMLTLGETLSVWAKPTATAVLDKLGSGAATDSQGMPGICPLGTVSKESRVTGEEAFALAGAHIGLLRALLGREGWSGPLGDCLQEACAELPHVVEALENATGTEMSTGEKKVVAKALCNPSLWMAHACFALLGGSFQGLHVGGRALALLGDGDGATVERCTVLAMEQPLPHYLEAKKRHDVVNASNQSATEFVVPAREWKGLQTLGDAVVVCLHSEPEHPRVLPRDRVSPADACLPLAFLSALKTPPLTTLPSPVRGTGHSSGSASSLELSSSLDRALSAEAQAAVLAAREAGTPGLVPFVPQGLVKTLVEAFGVLSAADDSDKRPRYKPLVVEKGVERILESPHPHNRGEDESFILSFPGAENIQLLFDESCRTEEDVAYIRIYKDERQTVTWGESKYHGRDQDANWPGMDGRPHLLVPASSCVVKFHSEDRNPDWGYRITARARCKEYTEPPERPPLAGISALSTLQACGAKALLSLVTSWPQFVPHALPLIKPLAHRVLCDGDGRQDIGKTRSSVAKAVVLESKHPYAHNANRREEVKVAGAKKLIVTFDERTRTESGCDYMSIYMDSTMTSGHGDSKYTGGKDGREANWPGTGGRPPLEIPASSFFFVWTTDGSVNDWGWRMTVTPVMGKIDPIDLPPALLDSKLASLLRICRECPREQPPAVGLEKFEIDPTPPARGSSLQACYFGASKDKTQSPQMLSPPSSHGNPASSSLTSRGIAGRKMAAVSDKWPRTFVINARYAGEVSLRAEPRLDSARIGNLTVNMPIMATGEEGDWLRVLLGPQHVSVTMLDAARAQSAARANAADIGMADSGVGDITRDARGATSQSDVRQMLVDMFLRTQSASHPTVSEEEGRMAESKGETTMNDGGEVGAVWALRRQGDMLFMVPEEEFVTHLVTVNDEGDPFDEDSDPARQEESAGRIGGNTTGSTTPAHQVVDPPMGADAGPASQGAFGIKAGEELATDSGRLWSALADTSRAAASRFSRLALTRLLARWGESDNARSTISEDKSIAAPADFSLEAFGGPEMLLALLRATFVEEKENRNGIDAAALQVLQKKIVDAAKGETEEARKVTDTLAAFSLHQLQAATTLRSFLRPTKAVVRTWETSHNYADNTDSYTKMSVPRAKRIRLEFDEKCSTESGCDFVRIYKDSDHKAFWGEHKYHGPAHNTSRVWPGVGGRPPLTIPADNFVIYFHSDSTNNDWGVRLSAYGIMQEPSVEERAALRAKRKELGNPETEMACWLLEALAKVEHGDYVKGIMYREATLETLVRFLESADTEGKIWVIHLLTAMLQDIGKPKSGEVEPDIERDQSGTVINTGGVDHGLTSADFAKAVLQAGGLASTLSKLADEKAANESDRGTESRSPLLQALVQACVVADNCSRRGNAIGVSGAVGSPSSSPAGRKGGNTRERDGTSSSHWAENVASSPPKCLATDQSHTTVTMIAQRMANLSTADATMLTADGRSFSQVGGSLFTWNMRIEAFSGDGPRVGVRMVSPASLEHVKAGEAHDMGWLLTWSCHRTLTVTSAGCAPISADFGPRIKIGDVITVEVNSAGRSVLFYRNQAFVGLAFGPVGSGAALEHGEVPSESPATITTASKTNRAFSPPVVVVDEGCWACTATFRGAVTLSDKGDAVKLVAPASASLASSLMLELKEGLGDIGEGDGARGAGEDWLGVVRDSLDMMSAVLKRDFPASFMAKDVLPKHRKQYSMTLESTHPLPDKPSERSIIIPGASALEVIFDKRTRMGPSDKISIFSGTDTKHPVRPLLKRQGKQSVEQKKRHHRDRKRFPRSRRGLTVPAKRRRRRLGRVLVGLVGGTEAWPPSTSLSKGIALGDRVVRGPSWDWGAGQDGGPGGLGTVVDVKRWQGQPRAGIKVLWDDTGFEGLYRLDYEGCFDLLVVGQGDTSTKPVLVPGDSVNIRVDPDLVPSPSMSASDGGWRGALQLKDRGYVSVKLPRGGSGSRCMASDFTLESWFRLRVSIMPFDLDVVGTCLGYPKSLETQGGPAWPPLISRGIMPGLSQVDIRAVPSSDGTAAKVLVTMKAADQSTGVMLEGGALAPGVWGHVAFSIDGAGRANLVVNGRMVASGVFRGPRMDIEDRELAVGVSFETEKRLTAHVYDFRLWSKALSASEIADGRKFLFPRGSECLLANFPFDDGLRAEPRNRGTSDGITAQLQGQCDFDVEVESPTPPLSSRWGWGCTVTPIYTLETLSRSPELKEERGKLRQEYWGSDVRHDLALVRYVNSFAEKKGFDAARLLRCSWNDMIPSEEDLVRDPLLRELSLWPPPTSTPTKAPAPPSSTSPKSGDAHSSPSPSVPGNLDERLAAEKTGGDEDASRVLVSDTIDTGVEETKGESMRPQGVSRDGEALAEGVGGEGHRSRALTSKKRTCISVRFGVLQLLNTKLRDALPYFDLRQIDRPWSAAALLSSCRGLIFQVVKEPVLSSALNGTTHRDGGQFDLKLSRSKAARNIQAGRTDVEGRWSVFGQAFRQMNTMHPKVLRTANKVYNCIFMGERAQDAGGPYRESWSMYAQELQSTALPLLIRTPNGKHAAGMGRDKYVPNPGATSPAQVEMFVFLGKLMGHTMRSKEYLGLNLSGVVWKALVGQEANHEDLEGVDVLLTRSMHDIRTIHNKGVTREIFSDIVMETFTALSLDDSEVELKPDGRHLPVTWDNRLEYADLVESHRLAECCSMVKYIRQGLSMVVPMAVLGMFTGEEVECMVCGKPEIDVNLLEAVTEYSGCRKDDAHIKLFWKALREFTPEERSMLIKFTWGRTRLPLTAEGFSQRFKLQSFSRSPPDDYLPVAHTCFFSLELPPYSTLEVMKERLRNAIYNCQAIDGDDTFAGMQAAALGWDWQEEDDVA